MTKREHQSAIEAIQQAKKEIEAEKPLIESLLRHTKRTFQPTQFGLPLNATDADHNEKVKAQCIDLESQLDKKEADWQELSGQEGKHQQAIDLEELVERCPTGGPQDLAKLESFKQVLRDAKKAHAPQADVDTAEKAVSDWQACCRNRKLLESYNEIAEKQMGPVLNEMFLIRSNASQQLRDLLDEQSSGCSHPLLCVNGLPIRFFPPESYSWQVEGKHGTGRKLWHWFPCAQ